MLVNIAGDKSNVNETLLADEVSTVFINCKPAAINGLRKFKSPTSWRVISAVVFLMKINKIPLFSKNLITFIKTFISLSARVIPEPTCNVKSLLEVFLNLHVI